MKNLKLIFGLLMISAFVATSVLNITHSEKQAVKKNIRTPRQG